jgi:hypothetical protein
LLLTFKLLQLTVPVDAKDTNEKKIVKMKRNKGSLTYKKKGSKNKTRNQIEDAMVPVWRASTTTTTKHDDTDYEIVLDDAMREQMETESLFDKSVHRCAVAHYFVTKLGAPKNESEWTGKGGICYKIKLALGIPLNTKIDYILRAVLTCMDGGQQYTGKSLNVTGRPPIIGTDTFAAQIVADTLEDGFSIAMATYLVNKHRTEEGKELYTRSSVVTLSTRLQPEVIKITKIKQGNRSKDSPWAKSRHNWVRQLMIRFGLPVERESVSLPDGSIPDYFNQEKMEPLSIEQIGWWDEMHKECQIGGIGAQKRNYQLQFKRDENGKLDPINGKASGAQKSIVNVKYEQEVRLCLGCATVSTTTTEESEASATEESTTSTEDTTATARIGKRSARIGKRCAPFVYSGKVIVSIRDHKEKQKGEMRRVQSLQGGKQGGWIVEMRDKGVLYHDDSVARLTKLGKNELRN